MISFTANIRTRNPMNCSQGTTRGSMIARASKRRKERELLCMLTKAHAKGINLPVNVTVTRIAPSNGLDPHDGLGAALKGCIDGIADGFGLKNDRDPRIAWLLTQTRGKPRQYAVEVFIMERP